MIHLLNVRFSRKVPLARSLLLDRVTATFPALSHTAIIGGPNSGKSTLAQIIVGSLLPDSGDVLTNAHRIAQLGYSGGLNLHLSGTDNVVLLARLFGVDLHATLSFVKSFAGLGAELDMPVKYFSPGQKSRLAYALSFAVPSDFILADETFGSGDSAFRGKCDALLRRRMVQAGLIFLTSNAPAASTCCNRFFALVRGRLIACDNAGQAQDLVDFAPKQFNNEGQYA